MRARETELLEHINALNAMKANSPYEAAAANKYKAIIQAFEVLQCEKLGMVHPEFLRSPLVAPFINANGNLSLKFWYFIQTNEIKAIEEKVKKSTTHYHNRLKKGHGIPPDELYSSTLIRSVYLSGNQELINVFKHYLPIPTTNVFVGHEIPPLITENKRSIERSIQAIREKSPDLSLDELTAQVIKIQRKFRAKSRYQEEIKRISTREGWEDVLEGTSPKKVIQDANMPYRPQCADKALAKRIMVAAQKVHLFSIVKHLTSGNHITSIFNDCIYGRRQLLQSYLPFRPASLDSSDVLAGDGNVICFGPFKIDPKAMQLDTVELVFDLDKISENNPAIFYKQRDLGFTLNQTRSLVIKESKSSPLFFSHTSDIRCKEAGFSYLSIYHDQAGKNFKGKAVLPDYSLISYNVQNIHQILTLNFFRFLDSKLQENFKPIKNEIYTGLAELSDKELLLFLENTGRQLSDTSEFNFYAAHRIDFSTLIALSSYRDGRTVSYTLNLQDLIASLERDDISMLNEAKIHVPGAFNSYRFLDYLLSKTTSSLGCHELQRLRSQCITPSWVPAISEPEPLEMPTEACTTWRFR